ncbi:MAG: ABC transporter permease [Bryobacteraceae bacterium]
MANWSRDLKYALKLIRQHPWFSATIILTMALGIGVNTTVFTLVNAVLFKPLPFPGGERIVMIGSAVPSQGNEFSGLPYLDIDDIRKQSAGALERVEAFSGFGAVITEAANAPDRYRGARITPGLFQMLGVQPVAGRGITDADAKPGAQKMVLLSYGVWKDRYALDPAVINRTVRLNEEPAVIAGIMPDGFLFPNNEKLWVPAMPDTRTLERNNRAFMIVARMAPGISLERAQAALDPIAARLAAQFPDTHKDHLLRARTFHQAMNGGPIRTVFLLMLGAVGFVLLIACANVANLLLSRVFARTREISIRAAMGASRWRILRQLLCESVTLSVAGGLAGLGMAVIATRAFGAAVANVGKPYWIDFSMDWMVFAYFSLVSVGAGVVFGLAPALRASRVDLNETLKEGARDSGGRRGGRLTFALVVLQYALTAVLLSGAGLMIRSFLNASTEFANVPARQILSARINLSGTKYAKQDDRRQFVDQLLEKLAAMPSAAGVAVVSNPPGSGAASWRFELPGQTAAKPEQRPSVDVVLVSPGYFGLLGLPLLRGRDFANVDGDKGHEAVIVNRQFVNQFLAKHGDPMGQKIRLYDDGKAREWATVVGVAPDLRQQGGPRGSDLTPVVFVPYRAEAWGGVAVLVRTAAGAMPSGTGAAVRREVQQLDQDLPLSEVMPLDEFFHQSRWYLRVFGTLFATFAVIAMGMAAIGIYGVIASSVGRRTREIGVRLALGADRGSILSLVMRRGVTQIGVGLAAGMGAALAVCRLMAFLLFRVSPWDPLTFGTVATLLVGAGGLACWLPARRAAALDPVRALREE